MIPYLDLHALNAPYEHDIMKATQRVVSSGWYLFGQEVAAFEKEWAAYNHAREAVACANGLDALRLTLRAFVALGRLHPGDGVIVPANTYIATILAISDAALTPLLVEPDAHNYLLSPRGVEDYLARGEAEAPVRALLPVHLYGGRCDVEGLTTLAERYHLEMLQDGAQGHGLSLTGTVAWSFYPGKNLGALGDAGAVTTDDASLAQCIRQLAFYGSERKYVHIYKGVNSRMDECQAAVLRAKLPSLTSLTKRRRAIAQRLLTEVHHPLLTLPYSGDAENAKGSVYHIFPVFTAHRDALQQYLLASGIHTQIHYPIPPHRQAAYKEWNTRCYPLTEQIAAEELSLPCNQTMTDDEVTTLIEALNSWPHTC